MKSADMLQKPSLSSVALRSAAGGVAGTSFSARSVSSRMTEVSLSVKVSLPHSDPLADVVDGEEDEVRRDVSLLFDRCLNLHQVLRSTDRLRGWSAPELMLFLL